MNCDVLLLGGHGYVGSEFRSQLEQRGVDYLAPRSAQLNCSDYRELRGALEQERPNFVINCAGYTGKPNVDACEIHKAECLHGNAVLPGIVQQACDSAGIPWGHVSSGCIFTGSRPDGSGFRETDAPNFCFRTDNCSFYSGTKALGEECLEGSDQTFIWRLRIPFDSHDSSRNYISKVQRYERLLEARNSISHLSEFVTACLDCWQREVPFGIYNVTNTGSITTREVVSLIQTHLLPNREFSFFESEKEFMSIAAKTPRSNCVMDNSKILQAGITMSPVTDAVIQALKQWQPETLKNDS